jgi:hypothetical protein
MTPATVSWCAPGAPGRMISTAAGCLEFAAPRVNDKRVDPASGELQRFSSSLLPPWCRRSPKASGLL